jgi:hypothetical protein
VKILLTLFLFNFIKIKRRIACFLHVASVHDLRKYCSLLKTIILLEFISTVIGELNSDQLIYSQVPLFDKR